MAEAIAVVDTLHADTIALEPARVSSERADALVGDSGAGMTTELLLLLARFHDDTGDPVGARLLASFAVQFAAHEAGTV